MPDDDLKDWSKNDLIREVRRLRSVASRVLRHSGSEALMFESGVNPQGKPFVRMWWGDQSGQLTVDEAYQHSRHVMEVAAAAHFDAAFVRLFREKLDAEDRITFGMLTDMRYYRHEGSGETSEGSGFTVTELRPDPKGHG